MEHAQHSPFDRLLVFPEHDAPDQGVLAHAGQWGKRLGLSVEVVERVGGKGNGPLVQRARDLCMLSQTVPERRRRALLRESTAAACGGLFFTPAAYLPVSRIVVLCQQTPPSNGFLRQLLKLCEVFEARLSLVAAAGSLARARALEQASVEAMARHGFYSDCDVLAGLDVRTAVATLARWRNCQLVAVESPPRRSWWARLLHDRVAENLVGLLDTLGVLVLPDGNGEAARNGQNRSLAPGHQGHG
jgi:hypothetical protein